MRKLIMAINISADGYCDHRAGIADAELHNFFSDLLREADTMLFGRKTFDLMYPYWPTVLQNNSGTESEITFARVLDEKEKIVFSRKGINTTWKHTRILNDLNRDLILKLKEQEGGNILISGIDISDQLTRMHLVDEYYFVVHPVIYGKGKRFFESLELDTRVRLDLFKTQRFSSGAIALFYRVVSWNF
ncbi:MAG: dihydrofolate reductase family protein [Ginsengibacter sp.]